MVDQAQRKTAPLSLEQQRAAFAWQKVQGANSEYTTLAKAAPALIMNNGLMQTLAFYQDKDKGHHRVLLGHLVDWLAQRFGGSELTNGEHYPASADFASSMNALLHADAALYRRATDESLVLLRWIRQFAAAVSR